MKSAIVIIAYNRIESIKRLINSIENSVYIMSDEIDLIISIDFSNLQNQISSSFDSFKWNYGEFKVINHNHNLGLKKHVFFCGNLSSDYDFIIMLEDDLSVSPYFYTYSRSAIEYFMSDKRIAGISLYTHKVNNENLRIFEPVHNGYDTYLFQYAQSWGQVFTKDMWRQFAEFYENNLYVDFSTFNLPGYISRWGNKSWLKFFMLYIFINKLYFVYPYIAYSTNHSEAGEHNRNSNTDFMVPMNYGYSKYNFPNYDQAVKYDIFFEREAPLISIHSIATNSVTIDLYGCKNTFDSDILISTKAYDFKIIKKLKLHYRPHEINLLYPLEGEDIFVYDTNVKEKNHVKENKKNIIMYEFKNKKLFDVVIYCSTLIYQRIFRNGKK